MNAPSAAHATAYGPYSSPSPISTPIANSSGRAGTIAPTTITPSQNAIAKLTSPAASGCPPIQATSCSNPPLVIRGLYGAEPGRASFGERVFHDVYITCDTVTVKKQ